MKLPAHLPAQVILPAVPYLIGDTGLALVLESPYQHALPPASVQVEVFEVEPDLLHVTAKLTSGRMAVSLVALVNPERGPGMSFMAQTVDLETVVEVPRRHKKGVRRRHPLARLTMHIAGQLDTRE